VTGQRLTHRGSERQRKKTRKTRADLDRLQIEFRTLSESVEALRAKARKYILAGLALAAVIAGVVALAVFLVTDTGRHARPVATPLVILGVSIAVLVAAIAFVRTSSTGPTITMRQLGITAAATILLTPTLTIGAELALRAEFPDVKFGVGTEGPEGPEGKKGPEGREGKEGPEGKEGSEGREGPRGRTGSTGASGARGKKGYRGPRGTRGPEGLRGPRGPRGEPGYSPPLRGS
jgi:hypothetical protein